MTYFKNTAWVQENSSAKFDEIFKPGESCPHSGIYRCTGCGHTSTSNVGQPLPPQNHHQHKTGEGDIRWQMIVWA